MAGKKYYGSAEEYEQKLERVMKRLGATEYRYDWNRKETFVECAASKMELPGVKLMAVGAAFNFLSGTVKRAPVSWQKAGFEWLWRILHEPKQFFRYVKSAIVCFVTRDR